MLLRALIDLLPSRQPLAYGRCCAWTGGTGNMRLRPRCHGRTLRRCRRPMKFRPGCRYVRGSPLRRCSEVGSRARRRCGEVRRRMRRHGRSLRHGRGMECRRGGTRHGGRRRRTGHCRRWCCRPSRRRCGRPRWSTSSVSRSLGGRANARRQHRDANQESRHANATGSMFVAPSSKPPTTLNARVAESFVVGRGRPCDLPTQAASNPASRRSIFSPATGRASRWATCCAPASRSTRLLCSSH